MRSSMKGQGEIAFFLLIGLLVVASAWIFFIFFKVNVTSIGVDVNNVDRYQEVPTTLLGTSVEARTLMEIDNKATMIKDVNCFPGNGPAGKHDPNAIFCTKLLPFYYSKYANGVGDPLLKTNNDAASATKEDLNIRAMKDVIRSALPDKCYFIIFRLDKKSSQTDSTTDVLSPDQTDCLGPDGSANGLKLDAIYTIPIFFGTAPKVAEQVLQIASTATDNDQLLITWPKYNTKFVFGGAAGG